MGRSSQAARHAPSAEPPSIEFALVLPLFCRAVMFGTVDYGWYFYQKFTLAAAIQSGVRASLSMSEISKPDDAWETAHKAAKAFLNARGAIPGDDAYVTFGPLPGYQYGGVKPGRYVTLTGTYTVTGLVGFIPLPSRTITYSASMTLDAQNADI